MQLGASLLLGTLVGGCGLAGMVGRRTAVMAVPSPSCGCGAGSPRVGRGEKDRVKMKFGSINASYCFTPVVVGMHVHPVDLGMLA